MPAPQQNTVSHTPGPWKACALRKTIATPGDVSGFYRGEQHVMACHEEHEAICIGWLMNQVGVGNNIALRIQMIACENAKDITLRGPQHRTFEDTLP